MEATVAQIFEKAETEARVRIERDIEGASPEVRALLKEIAARLFEDFNAGKLRKKKRPSVAVEAAFKEKTGMTLAVYIKEQRMLTATRLLQTTDLPVNVIAAHVGGVRVQGWSHAYTQWAGRQPSDVREQSVEVLNASERRTVSAYLWLEIGELDDEQSSILHDLAQHRCQRADPLRQEAQGLEGILEEKGLDHAREICQAMQIYEASLFEALCERSRRKGRRDRRRGVDLVEMALALVEGNLERLKDEGPPLLALAWARLGNARRIAADLEGAEDAILCGEAWLERAGKPVAPEAEILALKGSLRLFQRRFDEALELLDEAAGLSEALGKASLLVDVLHQRAAIHLYQGRSRTGVPDLKKAHDLIPATDKRRRMASLQHQLFTHVLSGDTSAPQRLLPQARQLSIDIGDRASWLQIRWIEGLCHREQGNLDEAEPLLTEAREGFLDPKDAGMLAIVSLELGLLYLDLGQPTKVIAHAAEALPALEALKLPEALGAYTLLREAVLRRRIGRGVLEQARQVLLQF